MHKINHQKRRKKSNLHSSQIFGMLCFLRSLTCTCMIVSIVRHHAFCHAGLGCDELFSLMWQEKPPQRICYRSQTSCYAFVSSTVHFMTRAVDYGHPDYNLPDLYKPRRRRQNINYKELLASHWECRTMTLPCAGCVSRVSVHMWTYLLLLFLS